MTGASGLAGPPAEAGTVYLVGGGPGDPGLLSLRAARLLSSASLVAYDRLAPPEALVLCPAGCERLYVGKMADRHALDQAEIDRLLVERARAGDAVVRFKGGDPFVLGRGSEEAQACAAAGVPFEVVPAATAGVAAPAYAGIPVTHRGVAPAFAVVTGHEDPSKPAVQVDYAALAAFPGTLVLYMGAARVREIATALVAAGRDAGTPAAVVEWGTTPRQRTVAGTLADLPERAAAAGVGSPAVIVVGEVVALRGDLGWFERRPLHGVSVLVPRTRQQASALTERLRALGAEAVEAPTIAVEPGREPERLETALAAAGRGAYDWVALTSPNGVEAVFSAVAALGADARLLARVRVAAVGSGTAAALRRHGIACDLLPERFTTSGLCEALAASSAPARILLPRADIAGPALARGLADAGWSVDEVEAYRTVRPGALPAGVPERVLDGGVDVLAFASSSTVRNLVDLLGGLPPPSVRVASIGPVTSETCHELGLRVDAEADPHDVGGLVEAVRVAARAG